jgi:putative adenylate-forming enzyme
MNAAEIAAAEAPLPPQSMEKLGYELKRLGDFARTLVLDRGMRARERWTRHELERYQRQQLAKLVRHARTHSPFYAERYRHVPLDAEATLDALPPIDKATVMENFDRIVTDPRLKLADLEQHVVQLSRDELYLGEYRALTTGGTTGLRGLFVYDRQAWSQVQATLLRWTRFMDVSPRLPRRIKIASIGSDSVAHASCRAAMSTDVGLYRILRLNATDSIASLVRALNEFQPELLSAYPSIAALLAAEQAAGRLCIRPRIVSTGSELCTAGMRREIVAAWRSVPFNNYALVEAMLASAECAAHGGIHVFEDLFIVEVVDQHYRPVADGVAGDKVLLTNLFNPTQPLIRYEVSDMLTMATTPCRCGRPFRSIARVDGRTDDIVFLPGIGGGEVPVHPDLFHTCVELIAQVKEYQVIHDAAGIHLRLVARDGSVVDGVGRRLREKLVAAFQRLDAQLPLIDIEFVSHIARDPKRMGKLKLVQSTVPRATPRRSAGAATIPASDKACAGCGVAETCAS